MIELDLYLECAYDDLMESICKEGFPGFELSESQTLPVGCTAVHNKELCNVEACLRAPMRDLVFVIRYARPQKVAQGVYSNWAFANLWDIRAI